jgi:hypothetical protein
MSMTFVDIGGAGSGGGTAPTSPSPTSSPTTPAPTTPAASSSSSQYQPWANPDPQSIVGLNSAMVYGENIAVTTGVNHAVTIGSNVAVCVNPGTLISMLGGPACSSLNDFFGAGGLGGNMTFTIGTNTQVNWGRSYTVNMGGEPIAYEANQQKAASKLFCAIIGATCIAYTIAYGACSDEDGRATIVIVFQLAMDVMLAAFMAYQAALKAGAQLSFKTMGALYDGAIVEHTTKWESAGVMIAAAATGVLGAVVAPLIAVAVEENHFASQESQTQSS